MGQGGVQVGSGVGDAAWVGVGEAPRGGSITCAGAVGAMEPWGAQADGSPSWQAERVRIRVSKIVILHMLLYRHLSRPSEIRALDSTI